LPKKGVGMCYHYGRKQPPLFDGDQIFLIAKKGGHVTFFEKPLTRAFQLVSLCGDQKLLVATVYM
jgi:hypothetical protein